MDFITDEILEKVVTATKEYPSRLRIYNLFERLKDLTQKEIDTGYLDRGELASLVLEARQLCLSADKFEKSIKTIYQYIVEGKVPDEILHIFLDFVANWTGYYMNIKHFRKKKNKEYFNEEELFPLQNKKSAEIDRLSNFIKIDDILNNEKKTREELNRIIFKKRFNNDKIINE